MGKGLRLRKPLNPNLRSEEQSLHFRSLEPVLKDTNKTPYYYSRVPQKPIAPDTSRLELERLFAFTSDPALVTLLELASSKPWNELTTPQQLRIELLASSSSVQAAIASHKQLTAGAAQVQSVLSYVTKLATDAANQNRQVAKNRDIKLSRDPAELGAFKSMLSQSVTLLDIVDGSIALPESTPLCALTYAVGSGIVVIPSFRLTRLKEGSTYETEALLPNSVGEFVAAWKANYRFLHYGASDKTKADCEYLSARVTTRKVQIEKILSPKALVASRVVEFLRAQSDATALVTQLPDLRVV